MSLILDALRKADAERQQGAVPDLHAQPLRLPEPAALPAPSMARRAGWMALIAALAAVAAGWALWPKSPGVPAAPGAVTHPAGPGGAPAPSPVLSPALQTAAPGPGAQAPLLAAVPSLTPPPAAKAPAAPTARNPAAVQPPAAGAAPAAPAAPLPRLEALPPELRAQVPAMTVGGSVHSPVPASRMIIVNGQVLREGDSPAPGVRLETIGRKSAVFSVAGQRFELPL